MQRKKTITAEIVYFEMLCDSCNRGYMRVIDGEPVIHSNPKQWKHRCSNCGEVVWITIPYPFIEYRGEPFMLAKHARFQTEIMPVNIKHE
ncbi:hypothetical protein [Shewanella algae]|uniref:hypothetical protein n=1 Tax=Shewanella algae TaxID=38313 RepID=UPI001181D890|nr:hypothetical protein [Shewanella algae]TVL14777.1 hypothetical protein AYJ02_11985 [Shewanella algae]HEW9976675.1 hypothetical protein [Shewanella algae]